MSAPKKTTRRAPSLEQRTRELAIELAKVALSNGSIATDEISDSYFAGKAADRYLRLAHSLLTNEVPR